jgi:tetratricopeptide (TPR) repeat protein
MLRSLRFFAPLFLLLASGVVFSPLSVQAQNNDSAAEANFPDPHLRQLRDIAHNSADWALIEPHLPDPATSSAAMLELEGDVLRARRFPADALEYFRYAYSRGGNPVILMNKMGVTELELGNVTMAQLYFQRSLKRRRKDSQAWNNLGAVEFMQRRYGDAIHDYKQAVKYGKTEAVYHSNLALAYIESKEYDSGRNQLATALRLDPEIFARHNTMGSSLHILATGDRAGFCFEMAKAYAQLGNEPEMLHSLETASEAGLDIQASMANDKDLSRYVKDPRVVEIVRVAKSMRANRTAGATIASSVPPLAATTSTAR